MSFKEYLRFDTNFFEHRKVRRLIREYGIGSVAVLLKIWTITAKEAPLDGVLKDWQVEDLIYELNGDKEVAEKSIEGLMKHRFIYEKKNNLVVHEWQEHQTYFSERCKRSQTASQNARKRWQSQCEPYASGNADCNASGMQGAMPTAYALKESKVKERKEKENKTLLSECIDYKHSYPFLEPCTLFLDDKGFKKNFEKNFKNWKSIYTNINLEAEIQKAHAYILEHPEKGYKKFIAFLGGWVRRANERQAPKQKSLEDMSDFELIRYAEEQERKEKENG